MSILLSCYANGYPEVAEHLANDWRKEIEDCTVTMDEVQLSESSSDEEEEEAAVIQGDTFANSLHFNDEIPGVESVGRSYFVEPDNGSFNLPNEEL